MSAAFCKLKSVLTTEVLPCGVCACSVAYWNLTLDNFMDCSPQALLSMGFCRREYWSGLSLPSRGDLSGPEIEPTSPASPSL